MPMPRLTTDKFIERCKKINGDRYDYSLSEYTIAHNKVKIICKDHGVFEQIAHNHLMGYQCPICARKINKDYSLLDKDVPEGGKVLLLANGGYCIVDESDHEHLSSYEWRDDGNGYARTTINGKSILMHRYIMFGFSKNKLTVDHINHNPMDNRRCNLRESTMQQQNFNKNKYKGSSAYKGVSFRKDRNKWAAYIRKDGILKHLGFYDDEKEAGKAYNSAAETLFGEYACLNNL